MCLFERHCLVIQAEVELVDAIPDRVSRRHKGRALAHTFGLRDDEARLFEVVLYSPDRDSRIAAGQLLCHALSGVAENS